MMGTDVARVPCVLLDRAPVKPPNSIRSRSVSSSAGHEAIVLSSYKFHKVEQTWQRIRLKRSVLMPTT